MSAAFSFCARVGDPQNRIYAQSALKDGQTLAKGFTILLNAVTIEERNLFQRFYRAIDYIQYHLIFA